MDPADLSEALNSLYNGRLTCWISGSKNGGINGLVLTSVSEDDIVKKRSLVIYFAYRFGPTAGSEWINGVNTLKRYAKSIGCCRVVAHPDEPEVAKLCESLGGRITNYFVQFDVD
jgi:hypothetical protein